MSDRARATSPARGRQRPDERTQVFTGSIFRTRAGMGLRFDDEPPPPPPEPVIRPAKVARMLALAHKLQRAIDRGEYESRADLAPPSHKVKVGGAVHRPQPTWAAGHPVEPESISHATQGLLTLIPAVSSKDRRHETHPCC